MIIYVRLFNKEQAEKGNFSNTQLKFLGNMPTDIAKNSNSHKKIVYGMKGYKTL